MTKYILALALALGGCGSSVVNPFADGGVDGSATDDAAVTVYAVEPGNYAIVGALRDEQDGCKIDDGTLATTLMLAVTNDSTTGQVSLGNFGTGAIAFNQGTLTKSKTGIMAGALCTYDYARTSVVTVTSDDHLTVKFTEVDTNRLASCTPAVTATCTSSWTMDIAKK